MYAHKNKSVRALYEQKRRKAVISESRDYQLLSRWLLKTHPDTFAQFVAFKAKLQYENPYRKDLSTSAEFLCFMDEGDGMRLCFFVFWSVV